MDSDRLRASASDLASQPLADLTPWELWVLGFRVAFRALDESSNGDAEEASDLRVNFLRISQELERRARGGGEAALAAASPFDEAAQ